MSYTQRDDQHRAGAVSSESSRVARLPVPFLAAALDRLDDLGLCACWVASHQGRRCKRWRSR
jgi:hypothetical protein